MGVGQRGRSSILIYNANSGVAVIIGMETQKILFIGVRNKYCSTCAQAEKKEEVVPNHLCFKNWSGSSSSMETDIIVEGFQKAESQHGVRYLCFVGDGDSSVYADLVAKVPVWGYAIKKMECANHATKCYRSSLEKLAQDNSAYKGKGKLTEGMKKRLTKAARCAISMRSQESDKKLNCYEKIFTMDHVIVSESIQSAVQIFVKRRKTINPLSLQQHL